MPVSGFCNHSADKAFKDRFYCLSAPLCMCVVTWWELPQDLSVGTKSISTTGGLHLPYFSKELMVNFLEHRREQLSQSDCQFGG